MSTSTGERWHPGTGVPMTPIEVPADGTEVELVSDTTPTIEDAVALLGDALDRQQARCAEHRRVQALCREHRERAQAQLFAGEIPLAEFDRYLKAENAARLAHDLASAHGGGLMAARQTIGELVTPSIFEPPPPRDGAVIDTAEASA